MDALHTVAAKESVFGRVHHMPPTPCPCYPKKKDVQRAKVKYFQMIIGLPDEGPFIPVVWAIFSVPSPTEQTMEGSVEPASDRSTKRSSCYRRRGRVANNIILNLKQDLGIRHMFSRT